jgi:hypothetical protein
MNKATNIEITCPDKDFRDDQSKTVSSNKFLHAQTRVSFARKAAKSQTSDFDDRRRAIVNHETPYPNNGQHGNAISKISSTVAGSRRSDERRRNDLQLPAMSAMAIGCSTNNLRRTDPHQLELEQTVRIQNSGRSATAGNAGLFCKSKTDDF